MSINPITIAAAPGVISVPTKASKSAAWAESNLMRWIQGRLAPIGGWSKLNYTPFASELKKVHRWTTKTGNTVIGYLCEQHLYVDYDGTLHDVTPVGGIAAPTDTTQGGYSNYKFGYGKFGTPRPARVNTVKLAPVYTLDNWGENLLAMTSSDGRLLEWDPNSPTSPADVVANAPVNNRTFVVTPQRHVILFGADATFNKLWWCDEENNTNWDIANVASKAGDYTVQPASAFVSVSMSGADILAFTANNNAFVISYIGLPYIYSVEKFQCDAVPMSPNALIDTPVGCVWATIDGFWYYSGGSAVSLACSVWDWVDKLLDDDTARQTASFVINPMYSEVYFFFPSSSAGNDRYVVFNYKDSWWANGKMKRTCGVKSQYAGYPLMSDGKDVYQHDSGNAYALQDGEELPYIKSQVINTAGGALMTSIPRALPDLGGDGADLEFFLEYQIDRSTAAPIYRSPAGQVIKGAVGFGDAVPTGRDLWLVARQKTPVVKDWTMGDTIVETIPRGRL